VDSEQYFGIITNALGFRLQEENIVNVLGKVLGMFIAYVFWRPDKELYSCKNYDEEQLLIVTIDRKRRFLCCF